MPPIAAIPYDQRLGPLPAVQPPPAPSTVLNKSASVTGSKQGSAEPYTRQVGPDAWYATQYDPTKGGSTEWILELSAEEVKELDAAIQGLLDGSLVIQEGNEVKLTRQLTHEDFVLPTLGPKLQQIQRDVHWGRGFAVIRGIPVQRYSPIESALAYWGIGLYWGNPVRQNKKGHLLGHIKDLGFDSTYKNPETRVYMTRAAQPWHSDAADLVGLLCLKSAKSGGLSRWCSSVTIYNEILATRPDLVEVMAGNWYWDRKNEVPEGKAPYFNLPVVNFYKGYVSIAFDESYVRLAPKRNPEVPPLTEQQLEVIDLINNIASRPDVQLQWSLQPGDLQLLNNHIIFHTRDAWEEYEDPEKRRHLLRLWLAPLDARPLPEHFAEVWHSVTPGARGGIVVPGGVDSIPLQAEKGN